MDKQNNLDSVSRKALIKWCKGMLTATDAVSFKGDWTRGFDRAMERIVEEIESGHFDIPSTESEGEAETRIKELEEENRILRSLAKQREKSRDECLDHALQKEREIAVITADNEQLHVALKDIHYQIQQSNHPAGLGILAAINQVLSTTSETAVQAQSLTGEKGKET